VAFNPQISTIEKLLKCCSSSSVIKREAAPGNANVGNVVHEKFQGRVAGEEEARDKAAFDNEREYDDSFADAADVSSSLFEGKKLCKKLIIEPLYCARFENPNVA
jgi:hypothetical protein